MSLSLTSCCYLLAVEGEVAWRPALGRSSGLCTWGRRTERQWGALRGVGVIVHRPAHLGGGPAHQGSVV